MNIISWLNGEFHDDTNLIDIGDRGFLLGDGLFETMLVIDGVPVFLSAHLARMRAGAAALGIDVVLDQKTIAAAIKKLAATNLGARDKASARLTLTRGSGERGLSVLKASSSPTLLLTLSAYSAPPVGSPVALIISKHCRSERSISSAHKTLNYLDNVLARAEADANGAGDALMLNSAGRVACATAANFFIIRADGTVVTPPVSEGALPGIVRGILLSAGVSIGCNVNERAIELGDIDDSLVFLTNSLSGIMPASLPGKSSPLPNAQHVLECLQSCYANEIRKSLERQAVI